MQMSAVQALGSLSPDELVKHSVDLVKKLEHADAIVRCAACRALGSFCPDELVKHSVDLVKKLEDADAHVRQAACRSLGNLPPVELGKRSQNWSRTWKPMMQLSVVQLVELWASFLWRS